MWAKFKRTFTNRLFHNLESLSQIIYEKTKTVNKTIAKSTCGYNNTFEDGFGLFNTSLWYKKIKRLFFAKHF